MINNTQNSLLGQMQALEALARNQSVQPGIKLEQGQGQDFSTLMRQAVNQVNSTQAQAADLSRAFELGDKVDLAEVMIAVQKSRISFEALSQVRNKLLSAYQDVMNMSV